MKNTRKALVVILSLAIVIVAAGHVLLNTVEDTITTTPTIELTDDKSPMQIYLGEDFVEPGYKATSSDGKDISDKVKVDIPDMAHMGSYTIKYTVTGVSEKKLVAKRKVEVVLPPSTEEGKSRGLSVLMYHKVYDENNPPINEWGYINVDANTVSNTALEEELQYLEDEGYFFPTWEEVRAYVDGKGDLPEKSVVLTFDDGTKLFKENGVPVIERHNVPVTAFIITSKNGDEWVREGFKNVNLQSHSHDMHREGGYIGHGGIFTALAKEEAIDDLRTSQNILGTSEAFAYPFGDLTPENEEAVEEAGFLVAFTTKDAKVYPGDDPYALPRMRIPGTPTMDEFKALL